MNKQPPAPILRAPKASECPKAAPPSRRVSFADEPQPKGKAKASQAPEAPKGQPAGRGGGNQLVNQVNEIKVGSSAEVLFA